MNEGVGHFLALRSRALATRIEGEKGSGPYGRWTEIAGSFAFDWRGYRYVHNFGDEALRRLAQLLAWFESGPAPTFETFCGPSLEPTAEALIDLGYRPFHAHAFFASSLESLAIGCTPSTDAAEIEIRTNPEDFGQLGARIWNSGDPRRAYALACQHMDPRWKCLTVFEDDQAVAAATVFFDRDCAYLANAITLPRAQGRGLHARLLRTRIELARERGKTWIFADTQVGSGSSRNLERAGLSCVATCLSWKPRPPQ